MYVTDVRLPGLPLGGILSGGLQLEPHQAADAQRAISKVCQVRGGRGCGGQGDSFRVSHCHRGGALQCHRDQRKLGQVSRDSDTGATLMRQSRRHLKLQAASPLPHAEHAGRLDQSGGLVLAQPPLHGSAG
jgi:hypothetical protein